MLFRHAAILYLLLAVGGLLWLGRQRGAIPLDLFLRGPQAPLDLALGGATAAALLAVWEGLRRCTSAVARFERQLRAQIGALSGEEVVGLALLSAIAEELLFRGAMQQAWGFWPTAILFGLLHLGWDRQRLLWAVSALLAGTALGALVLFRQTLLAAITAHLLVNLVQLRRILGSRHP